MKDGGKRIIEVMQQSAPFPVFGRVAKTNFMMFDRFPTNQKHVLIGVLDALLQLMAEIARHRRDNALSFTKCGLERRALARTDLQLRDFKDHGGALDGGEPVGGARLNYPLVPVLNTCRNNPLASAVGFSTLRA